MIRLSIGIEDIDDILWDLEQALDKSQQVSPVTKTLVMAGHAESEASGPQLAQQGVRRPIPKIGQDKTRHASRRSHPARRDSLFPVNPSHAGKTILGQRVYGRVDEIDIPVDIIVFRPASEVSEIARQAVKINAKVLWLQLGVISEEGVKIARDAGLEVVMDRCCKIEHARFFGGLRTIGLSTGVLTSRLALKIPV